MPSTRRILLAVLLLFPFRVDAQAAGALPAGDGTVRGWIPLSSLADERYRLATTLEAGADDRGAYLLRSTSSMLPRRQSAPYAAILAPRAEGIWNGTIPYSINDGPAWAGRGVTARLVTGVEAAVGPFRLVIAPEVVTQQNTSFDSLLPAAWDSAQRARFTAPWSAGEHAIDLPYRPGADAETSLLAGESSLTLALGSLEAGVATESQWWGPGARNAILLSDNAGGFPHALVRTASPLATPFGCLTAQWIGGRISASPYDTALGGTRTLSGAAVSLSPSPGLSVGLGRIVYLAAADADAGDALAVFTRWAGAGDTLAAQPYEQMVSLFARWVIPAEGAEVYGEWARRRLPSSPGDFLEQPEHTQGYTFGAAWARPMGSDRLRLHTELTYLEKSATYRARPTGSWYAGRAVPQGYTHRGQTLGAAIGPGASSQWLSGDYVSRGWQAGVFGTRVRWANDAYYDKPDGNNRYRAHDVTVAGGLRGAVSLGALWLDARWTAGRRHNFFFQNTSRDFNDKRMSVSPFNHTLQISISPRLP